MQFMHLQQFVLHKGHMLSSCYGRCPFFFYVLFSVALIHSRSSVSISSNLLHLCLHRLLSRQPPACPLSSINLSASAFLLLTQLLQYFPIFLWRCTQYLPSESVQTNLISPLLLCPWTIQTKLSLWCTHFLKSCPSLPLQMQISALLIHPPLATPHM